MLYTEDFSVHHYVGFMQIGSHILSIKMPYYSRIIFNSFYNRLFPKLFPHNRCMPNHKDPEKNRAESAARSKAIS